MSNLKKKKKRIGGRQVLPSEVISLLWTWYQINSFTFIFPNIQTDKIGMLAFIHKRMLHRMNN